MEQREYDNLVKNRDKARERIDKLLSENTATMGVSDWIEWVSLYNKAFADWIFMSNAVGFAKVEDK